MYRLYYSPSTSAMAPHILLRELGVPHELVLTDTQVDAHRRPEYLRLNPHARVPTLADGDVVIYEAAAICLYLCDRHPEAGLAPSVESTERGAYYKWMVYLTNTIQPELMMWFYTDRYVAPDQEAALKARIVDRTAEMFAKIDAELAGRPYLLGETLSAADFYLFMLSRWTRNMPKKARDLRHLGAYLARLMDRPSVREVFAIEGIGEPYY